MLESKGTMSFREIAFRRSNSYEDAISRAASESRLDLDYWDIFHKRHEVSLEAEKGILFALGWDTSNKDSIDAERAERFRKELAAVLPVTAVVSVSEKFVFVAFPQGSGGSVSYDIDLEEGKRISGDLDLSQLEWVEDSAEGASHWARFRLRLPVELPLGYHTLRVALKDSQFSGECHLIICPDRSYLPDTLAAGGRTAGLNITLYG